MSQLESRIELHTASDLHIGGSYIVHCIYPFIKRLTNIGFLSLQHRFVNWTKPLNTSLIWGRRQTLLHTHVNGIWACDFLQVTDLFFRSLFVIFMIELKSRKVIFENRHPK